MKIGLFPLWVGTTTGGIATYDTELLPALAELAPDDEFHIYSPSRAVVKRLNMNGGNVRHHLLFPQSRWINVPISFPIAASVGQFDLIHMTHVPPPITPKPYVMTLHCFSTFGHPEFYPTGLRLRLNMLTKKGLRSARLIICVSKGLRDLAQSEFRIDPDRLAVAYNGVSDEFHPVPRAEARQRVAQTYGINRPYVLFVGSIAPRKNVARIVQAYNLFLRQTRSDTKLVLVGKKWIAEDVDRTIEELGLSANVIHIGHMDHSRLPVLYSAAEMLVFPSLWESFGIPVMESMACGTPVLTSRGSCLPETAGDAALFVDPYSVDDIAEGMCRIMSDSGLAETLRNRGIERAKQFTWRHSALQTLEAYRRAVKVH
jgi:glycosyltransferase involved in cell wall biosynthesis